MTQQLNEKFVIMAGVPKCGSTALYEYLNDHPQIAAAFETYFFWSPDPSNIQSEYLSQWKAGYYHNPLENYLSAFPTVQDDDMYRLDGSVGYSTTPESATLIHQHLPNVKLIFIFRNPVERFISWYKYMIQLHFFPKNTTLEQVIHGIPGYEMWIDGAYSIGKYAEQLRPYWELFNHDNILLLSFADLRDNPLALMKQVCQFLDIDTQPYDNYEFIRHNASHSAKNVAFDRLQFKAIMWVRHQLQRYPQVFRIVSAINHRTWLPLYQRLNSKPIEKNNAPDNTLDSLRDYYKDEARLLVELTGVDGLID